jgi:endonuclease-8
MPEGDTIHRSAARLHAALVGKTVRDVTVPRIEGERPHVGTSVERVEAVGKHLLIHFADGLTLQTHMMMSGSWHLYRPGERWQRPKYAARVVIEVDDWVAVCFLAPVVRSYRAASGHTPIDHLGVDLSRGDVDVDIAMSRVARFSSPDSTIAELLLDQRIACGVGNVYKSETLFACRVNPSTPLRDLDATTMRSLFATAARLLQANLRSAARTTVATGGLAVYGRFRRPCVVCGTPIERGSLGRPKRVTYWCPRCQPQTVRC